MNPQQKTIIRALQWVFYPVAVLMLAATLWEMFGGTPNLLTEMSDGANRGVNWIVLAIVLFFWVVFIALLWEFLRREFSHSAQQRNLGSVLLAIKPPSSPQAFLPVVGVLALLAVMNSVLFHPDISEFDAADIPLEGKAAFFLFYAIGHFLFVAFLLRAVRNRPFFVATTEGFVYEPGDLSVGLVRWLDIESVEEADLLYGPGSYAGPSTRTTLVVALKNADRYNRRYNPLLRGLLAVLLPFVRAQTAGKADLVIVAEDFGARYGEVKDLIMRQASAGR